MHDHVCHDLALFGVSGYYFDTWGEPKNDSKGEDDGLKIEQGEGTRRKKIRLHAAIVRSVNPYTG